MPEYRLQSRAWRLLPALGLALAIGGTGLAADSAPEQGTVKGCVELAGHSGYRGVASLWPALAGKAPDPRQAIRPPQLSAPLAADGCFALPARPGDYFVGAVVRLTEGGWQGPPRPGDMVFLSPTADGRSTVVSVSSGQTADLGRSAGGWPYAGFTAAATLAVTGRLSDPEGKPLAGLLVYAFLDSSMAKEPLAVSEPSDGDGRYLLRLPEPATVYLRAREHYGRRNPLDGGYMGVYGGATPQAVVIVPGGDESPRDIEVRLIPALRDPAKAPPSAPGENK